jgi:hypothetical protein
MGDRQSRLFEFQPKAHDNEREQRHCQDCEQGSQSPGATTGQLTSFFSLVLRKSTAAAIQGKQAIVIQHPEILTSSRTLSGQYL